MSILGTGAATRRSGMQSLSAAARLSSARETAGRQLKANEQATKMNMTGSGIAVGAMVGGPVGAVVGGALGYFGADLF